MANQTKILWQAPEFRHYEKSYSWYITFLAIAILIVGFFIIQKDLFAAICIGILSLLIILFAQHKPKQVEIQLTNKGVHFGELFFPYKQIKHFWIVHNEKHKTLNLETTAHLNNVIILELEEQNPDHVREFLIQFLPEHEDTDETLTQRISHKFKF